ncbi:hypothetical protein BJP25_18030 [Actinokineospora bangkokensis]|uniref:DUF732 domain-containing protein n=1 Tax=Actinokineospora bangkokensis TaxID=1193682 RepID=A0A1Q9LMZ9_9PSEU|nr:hypothetical protein BJP25_18030 [Actinokineospora bangkokensis]
MTACGSGEDSPTAQTAPPQTTSTTASTAAPSSSSAPSEQASAAPTTTTTGTSKPGKPVVTTAAPPAATKTPQQPGQQPGQPPVTRVTGNPARDGYLADITAAGVPVSATGDAEVLIGEAVCNELSRGTARATVVQNVASIGGGITPQGAEAMVAAAQKRLC